MEHGPILANVAKHISLNEKQAACFVGRLKPKSLKKKEFLEKAGHPCTNITNVHSGALRAFNKKTNASEALFMFAVAAGWIPDRPFFTNQLPAMTSIEALDDC